MQNRRLIACFVLCLSLALSATTHAQQLTLGSDSSAIPGVAAEGSSIVEQEPDTLRMVVTISGEGKTIRDAIAALNQRTEAAKKSLGAIATPPTAVTAEPARSDGAEDPQQQMMRMMMNRGGPKPKAAEPMVKVSRMISANWALKAGTADERIAGATELQNTIKAIDFVGKKAGDAPATPAAAEDEEERMGLEQQEGAKPGTPQFEFVKVLAAEDREKATVQAFKKARDQATRAARAAGKEVGEPVRISVVEGPIQESAEATHPYVAAMLARIQQAKGAQNKEDAATLVGSEPTKVSIRIQVNVVFAIK